MIKQTLTETGTDDPYSGGNTINGVQMLDLAEKSFKAPIINVFEELNEVMLKIKRKVR